MIPTRTRAAAVVAFALVHAAIAQTVVVLRPESFHIGATAPVRVHLESADSTNIPWDDSRVRWLMVRGEGTQENMDSAPGSPRAAGATTVTLPTPPAGAAAIGLDLKPAIEVMDADQLRAFTRARCDEELPDSVRGKVRVARVQSCKALLRVGDGPGSYASTSETTQTAEIVVHIDPTTAAVGSDLPIVTSVAGDDLEDGRVIATCLTTGKTREIRTEEEGKGHLHLDAGGVWRLEFHHLTRAKEGSGADWSIVSATLIFDVPAKEAAR